MSDAREHSSPSARRAQYHTFRDSKSKRPRGPRVLSECSCAGLTCRAVNDGLDDSHPASRGFFSPAKIRSITLWQVRGNPFSWPRGNLNLADKAWEPRHLRHLKPLASVLKGVVVWRCTMVHLGGGCCSVYDRLVGKGGMGHASKEGASPMYKNLLTCRGVPLFHWATRNDCGHG
jgi:hypothetical protein